MPASLGVIASPAGAEVTASNAAAISAARSIDGGRGFHGRHCWEVCNAN
jgi:hypothetical protein